MRFLDQSMFKFNLFAAISLLIILIVQTKVDAQTQTVGLFINDSSSFNGYTFFAPAAHTNTYLINNDGLLVNSWESDISSGLISIFVRKWKCSKDCSNI